MFAEGRHEVDNAYEKDLFQPSLADSIKETF